MWPLVLLIIASILLGLLAIFTILYYPVKNKLIITRYQKVYGKQIYKIAQTYDYYLINNLRLKLSDNSEVELDHVLFGNKYIYLIKDRYYKGGLLAKEYDQSWLYYSKKGNTYIKEYIDNPLKNNDIRRSKVVKATGLDRTFLICICLINDDCYMNNFAGESKDNFLCPLSKVRRLIKSIEKRDVAPINAHQLSQAVLDINKLNENGK